MKGKRNKLNQRLFLKGSFGKNILVLLLFLAAAPYFVNIALAQYPNKTIPKVKNSRVQILETYPHNSTAYTQGLFFHNGQMYESCGQYGESSFRKVDYKTGRIMSMESFDDRYFVEGSCVLNGYLYILTWYENVCFVYDFASMTKVAELNNPRQGWGLTTDGESLIMSDGSAELFFLDPQSFIEKSSLKVTMNGKELKYINELEYINGKIWANVYTENYLVVINPSTGVVEEKIDCSGLLTASEAGTADVLNGIAVNEAGEIFITGKYWPWLFKITVIE